MPDTFFHGARVTDAPSGIQPIQTVNASVIGIIGTAPNSAPATTATVALGSATANNGLTFTAFTPGANGNKISVALRNPAAPSQALSVTVNGMAIIVNLATDATGAITSTGALVMAEVNADPVASKLVAVTETAPSTGAGVVASTSAKFLSGGADEAFPLNTPVLVAGDQRQAAQLGTAGTLYPAIQNGIFSQIGAVLVVVRVAAGVDITATTANLLGGIDPVTGAYTGMQAFIAAESVTGFRPMILIAPSFTSTLGIATALLSVATAIRAHVLVEGPDTNDTDAINYRHNFGDRRIYVVDPGIKALDPTTGNEIINPNSAFVAGLIAATDANLGYQWSPSNQELLGITGTTRPVDYTEGNPNCRANLLNEECVATVIRNNGFRLWGNRTCSSDPQYAFLCVSRVADVLALSVQQTVNAWAVDRPITRTFYEDVADEVTAYMATLTNQGIILGGKCYLDPNLNTAATVTSGKSYFNIQWTPCYPAEDIEIQSMQVETYLSTLFSN